MISFKYNTNFRVLAANSKFEMDMVDEADDFVTAKPLLFDEHLQTVDKPPIATFCKIEI